MTTFPGPYLYPPAPCSAVLAGHEFFVGDPPPGTYWHCIQATGPTPASLVIASPLIVATYLVQLVHIRAASQDVAVTTHHWRWEGSGAPAEADFVAVETRMKSFWSTLSTYLTTLTSSREYRWYGPRTEPGNWGEAIRVTPVSTGLGTQANGLPQQIACSVTEITDVRKRWGRFYIPMLGTNALATGTAGNFVAAFTTAVANAASTMLGSDVGEFAPVVFGTPSPTSLPVRGIRVDAIPDVQRRRRWDQGGTGSTITF